MAEEISEEEEQGLSVLTRSDSYVDQFEPRQTRWREVVIRRAASLGTKKPCSICQGEYGLLPWPWMASFNRYPDKKMVTLIAIAGSCNDCGTKLLLKFPVYDYEYL